MGTQIPRHGCPREALRDQMEGMRRRDLDHRKGRHGVYVWDAGDHVADVARCQARAGARAAAGRVVH